MVKLLLSKDDIDLDSEGFECSRTPLSYAAEEGHEAVVKLLLARHGLDPNSKSSRGRTPLWYAVKERHETVVELLTRSGRG